MWPAHLSNVGRISSRVSDIRPTLQIEAMKAIWTETKPEYHGELVNFDTIMTWPKPVHLPAFRKMAQEAGRDPASLPVTIGGAPDDLDRLKLFRDLGAARVNVSLMSEAPDDILPTLDKWAGYIRQLRD